MAIFDQKLAKNGNFQEFLRIREKNMVPTFRKKRLNCGDLYPYGDQISRILQKTVFFNFLSARFFSTKFILLPALL